MGHIHRVVSLLLNDIIDVLGRTKLHRIQLKSFVQLYLQYLTVVYRE